MGRYIGRGGFVEADVEFPKLFMDGYVCMGDDLCYVCVVMGIPYTVYRILIWFLVSAVGCI